MNAVVISCASCSGEVPVGTKPVAGLPLPDVTTTTTTAAMATTTATTAAMMTFRFVFLPPPPCRACRYGPGPMTGIGEVEGSDAYHGPDPGRDGQPERQPAGRRAGPGRQPVRRVRQPLVPGGRRGGGPGHGDGEGGLLLDRQRHLPRVRTVGGGRIGAEAGRLPARAVAAAWASRPGSRTRSARCGSPAVR